MTVFFGDVCFVGEFFGRTLPIKHDAWCGRDGKGDRVCVYCGEGVKG